MLFWILNFQPGLLPVIAHHQPVHNVAATEYASDVKKEKSLGLPACPYVPRSTSIYSITLCADIPDNNNPGRVMLGQEPGHVFIILSQKDSVTGAEINKVFGFYPRRAITSLLFRRVHGVLANNGHREYNASVYKKINAGEFEFITKEAGELAKKKYNLNKFNCYNYALEVFNSIHGIEKLPVTHIRFPSIFGKGGSPCCLYRDLKKLKENGSTWAPFISFGIFYSPESCKN